MKNFRKAFGQHFLKDKSLSLQIAELTLQKMRFFDCHSLLEIGPGEGALTLPLLQTLVTLSTKPKLILCEKDRNLPTHLEKILHEHSGSLTIEIFNEDFLRLEDSKWNHSPPLGVVSNLPYSSGTAILNRLLTYRKSIPFMILMFQAEVAQRIRAENGTKSWGSLSLWVQNFWDVTKIAAVPPSSFSPPPKVQSEVVLLTRRLAPRISMNESEEQLWEVLLKTSFAHRRKMLRSGLPKTGSFLKALIQAKIDPTLRAEALEWADWDVFFKAYVELETKERST